MHSLREALNEERPELREKHNKLILQHDNAPAHNATVVKNTIKGLGWELLPHPLYSPDLAPSDYHLFTSLGHALKKQEFSNSDILRKWLVDWFDSKGIEFFRQGIRKLPERHPDSTWQTSPRSEEGAISSQVSQGGLASITPFRIEDCTLDSFEPIKILGKGNFAEVSLVREKISNKIYAMKSITRHRHFDEDYQTEQNVLELTVGRKFLIGLVAHFETDDMAYLFTDLVHGHDLLYYLEQVERMSEDCARLYSAERERDSYCPPFSSPRRNHPPRCQT
ncbi:hypothetical protein LAZ67_13002061 [Cordylochernes scorpioides]|uniref:Protein kinase domain-containing protein n=1 Tax=Cordylochernes scorpioides TaxID=51811 RepID=A0ABY6L4C6_9ARAC|nr:hypothetical protein LAZ67_13002061 [Cordylochernes scorpioides]